MSGFASRLKPLAGAVFGDLRQIFWLVVLIGVVGALIGALFLAVLRGLEGVLGPESWGSATHLGVLAGVGVVVALLTRWLGTPGNVELLVDNIHVLGGSKDLRDLRSLLPVSLVCIASGGAAGPEAPLVQTTGLIGAWVADRRRLSVVERRVLAITGMAAGFTVLFGSPLGGAIFALEILHRRGLEYYEALLPALVGAMCGFTVFVLTTGLDLAPVWRFPEMAPLRPSDLGWSLVAGIAAALIAILFTYTTVSLRRVFARVPEWIAPMFGGVALGALAFGSPYALTFGEAQIGRLALAEPAMGVLAVAAAAKFLGTSVTISCGWRGGFIIPLFFIGMALGRLSHQVIPQANEVVMMAALMAAINTGVTKTPIGSTLVVTEMAGLQLLPTTLIAAIVALLLTSEVGLIESQRSRDDSAAAGVLKEAPSDSREPLEPCGDSPVRRGR